jgi:hypothetical protein
MSEKTEAEPITIEFNILLFVFLAVVGIVLSL